MDPSDLSLFTSAELIDELMRRRTFLGVVVHSEEEFKGTRWGPERIFKVRFNRNLDAARAGRLLDVVGDHLESRSD